MTSFDGSPAEMPIFSAHADWLSPDEATAERLLSGQGVEPDAPLEDQTLALVFAAAARPATPRELCGEQAAVAAFELAVSRPRLRPSAWIRPGTGKAGTRRVRRIPALISAGALAFVALLGGTAAAGALPPMLQKMAHSFFDAPAPAPARPSFTHGLAPTGNGRRPHATPGPKQTPRARAPKANPNGEAKSQQKSSGAKAKTKAKATASQGSGNGNSTGPGSGNGNENGNGNGNTNGSGNSNTTGKGKWQANGHARVTSTARRPVRRPPR